MPANENEAFVTGIPYNNRELSWMDFNYRVLEEAFKKENPVLEKLKFISITSSNLDEFFMVRVAGLKNKISHGVTKKDTSGLTPKMIFDQLDLKIRGFVEKQYSCLIKNVLPDLEKENIRFLKAEELNKKQLLFVKDYFNRIVFPVLTPMAVDTGRPFPMISNKSLNIAVILLTEDKPAFAVVQVPSILPRFLELPVSGNNEKAFILLEDIIIDSLDILFELYEIGNYCTFRVTRNSDLNIDEYVDDLMTEIRESIKKRKRGRPVRLEISKNADPNLNSFLLALLSVDENEIYEIPGPIDLTFLMKFSNIEGYSHLKFEPIVPVYPAAGFLSHDNIFDAIKEKDILFHHPYESFKSVLDFVKLAASDSQVLAIKQTLYRVSGNSPIIAALIKAAENGKQVTVLVELKARFDEENNIHWAKKLEKSGCHVIYGLPGLKTHCKICLVVRNENNKIHRYVHMATGNYNDITAKIYTDICLFTCKEKYGEEASSLFNFLTGYSHPPQYNKFVVAPDGMREFFESSIKNEIANAKKNLKSGITVKINSLVDPKIIKLLYDASNAGVQIKLLVRGICCLIPGIKNYSENIIVYSIVGQLLEHSRIFKFENGGDSKIYLSSADWMTRNINRRVELLFPVEEKDLVDRINEILSISFKDTMNLRYQLPDTTYVKAEKTKKHVNSMRIFSKLAKREQKKAKRDYEERFSNGG